MANILEGYVRLAKAGTSISVDTILSDINMDMSISLSNSFTIPSALFNPKRVLSA